VYVCVYGLNKAVCVVRINIIFLLLHAHYSTLVLYFFFLISMCLTWEYQAKKGVNVLIKESII
jgi:hypothetical protein